jgi:hypothetical protein
MKSASFSIRFGSVVLSLQGSAAAHGAALKAAYAARLPALRENA